MLHEMMGGGERERQAATKRLLVIFFFSCIDSLTMLKGVDGSEDILNL
jgi:hypothetical protein